MEDDMEVFETVGSRNFSATLELNGLVILKEGKHEVTRGTLCDALASLGEEPHTPETNLLDTTIDHMLRVFIKSYAKVV
jgi:hypothetical protein